MLHVGTVPYLVGRPLDLGLEDEPGIELVYQVPGKLVEGLRDGSIDVALVSSIELFRRPDYAYIDTVAVAGAGAVSSVQVFLRRPVEEVRSLALDPASRTAATLTQIVWPGERPGLVTVGAGEDPRAVAADAWLRIGDPALRELWVAAPPPVFNPSEAWARRTGLPFVFALWIVRPGVDVAPHLPAFERAARRGTGRLEELAARAAAAEGLPHDRLRAYLCEECLYEPGADLGPALVAFRDGAAALDLADGHLQPTAVPLGGAPAG
jgi:chorismate dehydratase